MLIVLKTGDKNCLIAKLFTGHNKEKLEHFNA